METFLKKHNNEPTIKLCQYLISYSVMSKKHADEFKKETCPKKLMQIVMKLKAQPIIYTDEFFNKYYKN
jgi:hypothetical protein